MSNILPQDRFISETNRIEERYMYLCKEFPEDERWKKMKRNIDRMKKCYNANKMMTIKTLRAFEKYQMLFREEQRACIVQAVELLKKLLWHKKINRQY